MTTQEIKTKYFSTSNVAELTDEFLMDLDTMIEEKKEEFDWNSVFETSESIVSEVVVDEKNEEVLNSLNEKLTKAKNELLDWENKNYKRSTGTVYVGSELDGGNYSYNYINQKRKANKINSLNYTIEVINEAIKLIEEKGVEGAVKAVNINKKYSSKYELFDAVQEIIYDAIG